jgi:low temperature requirement protein LtrA
MVGAAASGDTRLVIWAITLAFEYLGPPTMFWLPVLGRGDIADWNVEGEHLAERCGLFMIIALGESLLITGATFSGLEWTDAVVFALVASFVAAVAMWWVYFDLPAEAGSHLIAHPSDPGRIARLAYTYIHLLMVAGIILTAVGDEKILAHPSGHTEFEVALVILGGPALFLVGHWLFKRAIIGRFVWAHVAAVVALGVLFVLRGEFSPVALSSLASAVLVGLAVYGRLAHRMGLET